MSFLNPISPIQAVGQSSVSRESTFGTTFSNSIVGGFMQVNYLTDLIYTIPTGTTGNIEYSGNTTPINFIKGNGSVWSPDVLTLNSDNLSSGRRKIGMMVYVREQDQVYQYTNDDFLSLWNAATAATGTVVISNFGTTVNNSTVAGQNFINSWTASTIDGYNGVVRSNAVWKKYYGNTISLTGGSYNSGTGTLTLTNITGGTQILTGFGSGGGGGSSITGGTFNPTTLNLDLNSTGSSVTINNVTGLYISAGTYSSSTNTILLYNSTGGTVNITGITSSGISGDYLPLSGGTVTGGTIFTGGLTANTISATTYYNLPLRVSGTGTQYYVTKWDSSTIGLVDSQIYDDGAFIGIGSTSQIFSEKLNVTGGGINVNNLMFDATVNNSIGIVNYDTNSWGALDSVAIGYYGPLLNSVAGPNIAIGGASLTNLTTGNGNISIGDNASTSVSTGNNNVIIGNEAFSSSNSGDSSNVAIGYQALNVVNGANNVSIGTSSSNNVQGSGNTIFGTGASNFVNGDKNIIIGYFATTAVTSSNRLYIGQDQKIIIYGDFDNRRVGINTNSPITTFDVSGNTRINGTLSANTISATTYQNLPSQSGTGVNTLSYSQTTGILTLTKNDTTTLTAGTFTYLTGASYLNNVVTLTNNLGSNSTLTINTLTGLTINGVLTVTGNTSLQGLTANTISATTYYNLPQSVSGTGTQYYVTKWDSSTIGLVDSQIYDDGAFIGIGTTTPIYSEPISFQTGNKGITIDSLYIQENGNGSLAFATGFDYNSWGTNGSEIAIGTRGPLENSTGSGNIGIGDKALNANTTGTNNIAIGGTGALFNNNTGAENTAIGNNSLQLNNDGQQNVSIGNDSLFNNINGDRNTVLGHNAGYTNLGSNNVYLGYAAGYNNDGSDNIFIGYIAGYGDTSSSNKLNIGDTIIGDLSAKSIRVPTISATTYDNLPGSSSSNCFTTFYVTNISGCSPVNILSPLNLTGGINVTGITNFTNTVDFSGGLTASTISATTYSNLPVSGLTSGTGIGITNNNNNFTISYTGSTGVNGNFLPISGGTVTGATNYTAGLSANTISATTYQNLPVSGVTNGLGISASANNGVITITNTGATSVTAGSGLSGSSTTGAINLINTDLGSSQNIFKNIQVGGVTQFSAGSNSANLNFSGINITITSAATNTLVFSAGTVGSGGVTQIIGTSGIGVSPSTGIGNVTLSYTGSTGGSSLGLVYTTGNNLNFI